MRQRLRIDGHKRIKAQQQGEWRLWCECGWRGGEHPSKHAADAAYRDHLLSLMHRCRVCDEIKSPKEMSKVRIGLCKACSNAKTREWKAANPNEWDRHARKYHLRAKYGIDEVDFDRMMADQQQQCAICESPLSDRKGERPHIDHCHETGVVRGLLCPQCNWGLGAFRDNLANIRRAAAYLERAQDGAN